MRRFPWTLTAVGLILVALIGMLTIKNRQLFDAPKQGMRGIRVLMPDGEIQTLDLEQYLVGVVSAEMPANFAPEALEAQAVAARTYAVRQLVSETRNEQSYDVDTTQRTQAWQSDQALRKKWGIVHYLPNRLKIEQAVKATKGLVLTYNGDYVQAFFFANSGRLPTERAEDVWGESLPYLNHVAPEAGERGISISTVSFSPAELDQRLGTTLAGKKKLGQNDVRIIERTTAGRAKMVRIQGKAISATRLRAELGLKSTDFTIRVTNNKVVFTAYGNGHAVGMSQYGANYLAQKGYGYKAILSHYYPGANLWNIDR
ncbi:MAG TPA: stage II sporulation protein D [Desulfobacteria bacterium]|nr:stage II sporulation protein D [Desulfobacteria bacterium]